MFHFREADHILVAILYHTYGFKQSVMWPLAKAEPCKPDVELQRSGQTHFGCPSDMHRFLITGVRNTQGGRRDPTDQRSPELAA